MKDYILEQLSSLTSIPSPSGYTLKVTDHVLETLRSLGLHPERTTKGTVTVTLGGSGRPLVLSAHLDTLGAMVREIKDNGRIRPTTVGGHQWDTCDGENCTVHTRDGRTYTGVVLNIEPSAHVADKKEEKTEEHMEILLDENVHSKEEVKKLGIQNGDFIAMDPRTVVTESGYIKSRFLDDKLSAAILLGLAKSVQAGGITLNRKVTLMFTVYEEVGHGASCIPSDTEDLISVDMGCVGDGLACTEREVSICAKDAFGPYDYALTSRLAELAREHELGYAIDIYPHYASDADAALKSGYDVRHGLIGPGVYASHNYERSHIDGMMNTYNLLKAFIMQ